jgi:hypothetical protein
LTDDFGHATVQVDDAPPQTPPHLRVKRRQAQGRSIAGEAESAGDANGDPEQGPDTLDLADTPESGEVVDESLEDENIGGGDEAGDGESSLGGISEFPQQRRSRFAQGILGNERQDWQTER